jgi:outer membrane biosynthesis protein TonB
MVAPALRHSILFALGAALIAVEVAQAAVTGHAPDIGALAFGATLCGVTAATYALQLEPPPPPEPRPAEPPPPPPPAQPPPPPPGQTAS